MGSVLGSIFGGGEAKAEKSARRERESQIQTQRGLDQKAKEQKQLAEKQQLKKGQAQLSLIKTSPKGVFGEATTGRGKLLGN